MNRRGFTLIEMLTVVIMIGILASIALPNYRQAVLRAKYTKIMPLVNELKQAEEEYYLMHRKYTYDFDELGFKSRGFVPDPSFTNSATNYKRKGLRNGRSVILLDENGGGAPVVQGLLGVGDKTISYRIYLDHASTSALGSNTDEYASIRGKRYCNCHFSGGDPIKPSDWRYKLCASLTGNSIDPDWEGGRFRFL